MWYTTSLFRDKCLLLLVIAVLLVGQLPGLQAAQTTECDKWAVVIGVSGNKQIGELPVAAQDARAVSDALLSISNSCETVEISRLIVP